MFDAIFSRSVKILKIFAKAYSAHARNICSTHSTTAATSPTTMAENWLKGFSASWIEPHSMAARL